MDFSWKKDRASIDALHSFDEVRKVDLVDFLEPVDKDQIKRLAIIRDGGFGDDFIKLINDNILFGMHSQSRNAHDDVSILRVKLDVAYERAKALDAHAGLPGPRNPQIYYIERSKKLVMLSPEDAELLGRSESKARIATEKASDALHNRVSEITHGQDKHLVQAMEIQYRKEFLEKFTRMANGFDPDKQKNTLIPNTPKIHKKVQINSK